MSDSIFKDPEDIEKGELTEIVFTNSARSYLIGLLEAQDDVIGIRVFINDPGTPRAETCIAYCRDGDSSDDAIERRYEVEEGDDAGKAFTAYFDPDSWKFLDAARIDYAEDRMGGQLTIKAP